MEMFPETSGTAALAGRDLPPAAVLAADKHLTALAQAMKAAGQPGTLDILRAWAYLHLLSGKPRRHPHPRDRNARDAHPRAHPPRAHRRDAGGDTRGNAPAAGTPGDTTPPTVRAAAAGPAPQAAANRPAAPARRACQRSRCRNELPRGTGLPVAGAPGRARTASPPRPGCAARST